MITRLILGSTVLAGVFAAAMSSSALAAEPAMVSKVGGRDVTWVSGEKSAKPAVQTLLAPGDRLSVGRDSFVEVEYLEDRCSVTVKAGGSITVGDISPCAAAAQKTAAAKAAKPVIIPAAEGAVEVQDKTGPVARVNKGDGLVDAVVGDALKVGDEVYAGPNSSVTIYFAVPNCSFTVTGSNLYQIPAEPPCKAAAAAPVGVNPAVIAGAGAVVAGAVVIAVIMNEDDGGGSDNPATPD